MGSKNMFSAAYASRQAEQEDMKKTLSSQSEGTETAARTTMTLSMTVDGKANLKMLATKKGKTVSGLLHEWIEEAMN